ncbi:MAG TPA: hypothetical protein VN815_01540, partial [Steroidobacteraceae bacterium]|nr:hypothetical protein [Steroidobacteraceae bacterium]
PWSSTINIRVVPEAIVRPRPGFCAAASKQALPQHTFCHPPCGDFTMLRVGFALKSAKKCSPGK